MTLFINGKTYEAGELIAYVENLEKEKQELFESNCNVRSKLRTLRNDYEVLVVHNEVLAKENAELKSRDCWKSCEYANSKAELIGQHIKDVQNLTKAKELLKKLKALFSFPIVTEDDIKRQDEILTEAEQFLNSEVQK